MTTGQRAIKQAVEESPAIFADRITCRADGTVEVRRAYFYRHGGTPENWGEKVAAAVPGSTLAATRDEYRQWPGTSYFVAVLR